MIDPKSNQNYEVIFPEEAASAIDELVTKYGFEKIEEEMLEKMDQVEGFEEKEKIFENLPGRQIARTVKEVAQGKIRDKYVFIATLQERLNISKETAQELSKDLEEKVLSLVQITFREEREIPSAKEIEETKPAPPKREDTYREPIE